MYVRLPAAIQNQMFGPARPAENMREHCSNDRRLRILAIAAPANLDAELKNALYNMQPGILRYRRIDCAAVFSVI